MTYGTVRYMYNTFVEHIIRPFQMKNGRDRNLALGKVGNPVHVS